MTQDFETLYLSLKKRRDEDKGKRPRGQRQQMRMQMKSSALMRAWMPRFAYAFTVACVISTIAIVNPVFKWGHPETNAFLMSEAFTALLFLKCNMTPPGFVDSYYDESLEGDVDAIDCEAPLSVSTSSAHAHAQQRATGVPLDQEQTSLLPSGAAMNGIDGAQLTHCSQLIRNMHPTRYRELVSVFESEDFCCWCLHIKPAHSKHCDACGRCIIAFDHHCDALGTCICECGCDCKFRYTAR